MFKYCQLCLAVKLILHFLLAQAPVIAKRETSYGNPDLVTDQGNQFKLNFGSTDGHPNACPGHFICCQRYLTLEHKLGLILNCLRHSAKRWPTW